MKILDFFKGLFTRKSKEPTPKKSDEERARKAARSVWKTRGDYTLENSELIFSAVTRISNALSAMPLQLYQYAKPVTNDLSEIMCVAPNYSPTCQWVKSMEACRNTYGNAYGLKVYDAFGKLARVDILDPARVTPLIEEDTMEKWYRVISRKGDEMYIHNFYMIHVPFISTNGHTGINPVTVLFDGLSYNEQMQTFSKEQLDKGINAQIVVEAPANLGDAQREETINAMHKTWKASSGNVLLLESGLTAKTLNLSPVDSKIFDVEKITRSKVAMVYNIPPHLMGDYSDTSFNSQEQEMIEFLTLTMLPIVTAYEQELDYKLLSREERKKGYHFKFDVDAILRADSATRADVNQKAVRGGWLKPNEVRADYGKPPDPNGNKLLVSRDLVPLETLIHNPTLAPTAAPAAKPAAKPTKEDEDDE